MKTPTLQDSLDRLVNNFDQAARVASDPVEFPRRYTSPADREIAAFIASALAYGRVDLFKPVVEKILAVAGEHPSEFIREFEPRKDRKALAGVYYRLSTPDDIACLLYILGEILRRHGSLKALFLAGYHPDDATIGPVLIRFTATVLAVDTTPVYGRNVKPQGITHLFPSPAQGSPCKRLCMFLRWMVRPDDGVDLGLWPEIPTSKLVIPLDTHVARISRMIGLTRLKSPSWRMAVDITGHLRRFDPADPVKYDFALAHLGISGECPTEMDWDKCDVCGLQVHCSRQLTDYPRPPPS